jgi:hypothetical protein
MPCLTYLCSSVVLHGSLNFSVLERIFMLRMTDGISPRLRGS